MTVNTPKGSLVTLVKKDPPLMDREQTFLLYACFAGDVERTAHAVGVAPIDVLRMADDESWHERLRGILELRKKSNPGDLERAINRAMTFVQGHRMRLILDRAITHLTGLSNAEFLEQLTPENEKGVRQPKARHLADLAGAIEKISGVCYSALTDTPTERVKRAEVDDLNMAGEIHLKITEAMAKVGKSTSIRARLFSEQLAVANELKKAKPDEAPAPPPPVREYPGGPIVS